MSEVHTYHCPNCHREVQVRQSPEERTHPQCVCGEVMKKPYQKPAIRETRSDTAVFTVVKNNRS